MKFINSFRKLLSRYRYSAWLLDGAEKQSGENLRIFYVGAGTINKNYFTNLVFKNVTKDKYLGRFWLSRPLGFIPKQAGGCDLAVTDIEKWHLADSKQPCFYVPCWVDGKVDIDETLRLAKKRESIKSDLRRIRKHGFTYDIERSREKFVEFYEQMYVPYIKNNFGNEAALHSLEGILSRVDDSELLMVMKGDTAVTAEVIVYRNNEPWLMCLGVLDGDRKHVKAGAINALYYYRLIHLKSKGFKEIDLGASRGFLGDGVLQYKKKWGIGLTGMRENGFLIHRLAKTAGTRAFLLSNPFLLNGQEGFSSVCFVDGDKLPTEGQQKTMISRFAIPGINRLLIYQLGGNGSLLDFGLDAPVPVEVRRF
ncbi:MAG: hypothetical protein HKM93_13325 [Desulfobacteraceae bacterium]|nr:hypothetical protein [Desulfobacteraceae bacterium]